MAGPAGAEGHQVATQVTCPALPSHCTSVGSFSVSSLDGEPWAVRDVDVITPSTGPSTELVLNRQQHIIYHTNWDTSRVKGDC